MPYLSPFQVSPLDDAARTVAVEAKLTAIVGLVSEVLATHDDGDYRVIPDQDARVWGDASVQRDVRLLVLGNPARYASVRWTGGGEVGFEEGVTWTDLFEISVFRGTGDGAKPGPTAEAYASANAAFRRLMENEGFFEEGLGWTSPPGLLYALRRQGVLVTETGDHVQLGLPQITQRPERTRPADDAGNPDDRHEIVFQITVT